MDCVRIHVLWLGFPLVRLSFCPLLRLSFCPPVRLSFCEAVLSSCDAVLLSSCEAVLLSSCEAVLLSSFKAVLLSSCEAVFLSSFKAVLLSSCEAVLSLGRLPGLTQAQAQLCTAAVVVFCIHGYRTCLQPISILPFTLTYSHAECIASNAPVFQGKSICLHAQNNCFLLNQCVCVSTF